MRGIDTREGANAYAPDFMADYNRRFARSPLSAHDAHRPMLPTEKLERVFTWQEERRLTLHYKRVLYLVEPNEYARTAAGHQVLVRESHGGEVTIEHKGVALPARAFAKDARVEQAAIVDNKLISAALLDVRARQTERDTETFAKKRLTLREEDLMRKSMDVEPLSTRRPGRPTLRELALARQAAEQVKVAGGTGVDQLVADTVSRLSTMVATSPKRRRPPRKTDVPSRFPQL